MIKLENLFMSKRFLQINNLIKIIIFLQGKEVAESSRQHVEPHNELAIGTKIKEYQQNPQDAQVRMDIGGAGRILPGPIERKHGKVLDGDVQTGR